MNVSIVLSLFLVGYRYDALGGTSIIFITNASDKTHYRVILYLRKSDDSMPFIPEKAIKLNSHVKQNFLSNCSVNYYYYFIVNTSNTCHTSKNKFEMTWIFYFQLCYSWNTVKRQLGEAAEMKIKLSYHPLRVLN